jgi:hypothetical protein
MDANSPTLPRKMTTAERRKQAVSLRMGGRTFADIGEALGISKQAAHNLVVTALKEITDKTAEDAETLRRLELERLDFMRNAIWGAVIKGDVMAIDRALRISKRMAELLGLDAPTKTDVTSNGETLNIRIIKASDDTSNDSD